MPCSRCHRRASTTHATATAPSLCYCHCGSCNYCHVGGWCPDNRWWFRDARDHRPRDPVLSGQSHGGHGWIPTGTPHHHHHNNHRPQRHHRSKLH